jgi:hypothetical protein
MFIWSCVSCMTWMSTTGLNSSRTTTQAKILQLLLQRRVDAQWTYAKPKQILPTVLHNSDEGTLPTVVELSLANPEVITSWYMIHSTGKTQLEVTSLLQATATSIGRNPRSPEYLAGNFNDVNCWQLDSDANTNLYQTAFSTNLPQTLSC